MENLAPSEEALLALYRDAQREAAESGQDDLPVAERAFLRTLERLGIETRVSARVEDYRDRPVTVLDPTTAALVTFAHRVAGESSDARMSAVTIGSLRERVRSAVKLIEERSGVSPSSHAR